MRRKPSSKLNWFSLRSSSGISPQSPVTWSERKSMGDWPDFSRAASAPSVATSWPRSNSGLRTVFCISEDSFGWIRVLFLRGAAVSRAGITNSLHGGAGACPSALSRPPGYGVHRSEAKSLDRRSGGIRRRVGPGRERSRRDFGRFTATFLDLRHGRIRSRKGGELRRLLGSREKLGDV